MLDLPARSSLPAGGRDGVTVVSASQAARALARRLALGSRQALAPVAIALAAAVPAAAVPTPGQPELITGSESVATTDVASAALFNPAWIGARYPGELQFTWSRFPGGGRIQHLLLARRSVELIGTRIRDGENFYGVGYAGGNERLRFGSVQGVSRSRSGDRTSDTRMGLLSRPVPWFALGVTADHVFQPELDGRRLTRLWTGGVGLRPLALARPGRAAWSDRVVLSADVIYPEGGTRAQSRLRFGAELEPARGFALRGSIEDHGGWHAGVVLRSPRMTLASHRAYAPGGAQRYTNYSVSMHEGEERSALSAGAERRVGTLPIAGVLGDESLSGPALMGGPSLTSVRPVREQLERALDDPLTRGMLLELNGVSGMAQIEELRPRIARLRAIGKPVVAYMEYGGGRGDLYLASACDRVVASPSAEFGALGIRIERRYYRRFFADLGLRVERSSTGRYKSAYRGYSVDSTGAADREATEHSLDVSQELFVSAVTADRRMDRARLLTLLDGREWVSSELQKAGLIDSVGYREDALKLLGGLAGLGSHPSTVHLAETPAARTEWTRREPIAVVYASGDIGTGRSGNDLLNGPYMGSVTITRQLEAAFRRRGVRAVVLRVDSPGGSALASDLIRHAAERLQRETGKPLIVSMGGTAASGGYEISIPGKTLFCDRYTRTGSIGVLTIKPSLEGFYSKHGIRQDDFERGRYMGGWSTARDWTAEFQASADSAIGRVYREFVAQVARARRRSWDEVHAVAQGRVWMGEDALARGLVDRIGGIDDAIAEARQRAGVTAGEKIRLVEYRRPRPGLIGRLIGSVAREAWAENRMPDFNEVRAWDDGETAP